MTIATRAAITRSRKRCETPAPALLERALQIAADVGRWCSGCASGVPGAVYCLV